MTTVTMSADGPRLVAVNDTDDVWATSATVRGVSAGTVCSEETVGLLVAPRATVSIALSKHAAAEAIVVDTDGADGSRVSRWLVDDLAVRLPSHRPRVDVAQGADGVRVTVHAAELLRDLVPAGGGRRARRRRRAAAGHAAAGRVGHLRRDRARGESRRTSTGPIWCGATTGCATSPRTPPHSRRPPARPPPPLSHFSKSIMHFLEPPTSPQVRASQNQVDHAAPTGRYKGAALDGCQAGPGPLAATISR